MSLCSDLNNGKYRHGSYSHHIVNEKKRRDIAVASVRDRIVHRLLYNYLVPIVDKRFDFDVWSCRHNKGLHLALQRTQQLTSKYNHGWVWRADIAKFFDSVNHRTLKKCITRVVHDPIALKLFNEVINSYCYEGRNGYGIPIGNLTSQIFANVYLHEFDRYIRKTQKPLGYLRYGDDIVVFASNPDEIRTIRNQAIKFLREELFLSIHKKTMLLYMPGTDSTFWDITYILAPQLLSQGCSVKYTKR